LRRRANSSRSAVVRPVLPLVRSARACSTQLRSDDSVRPRSRAAAATLWPSSRTRRMAPALKSSVKLRRVRLGFVSGMVDIVSASRKMSTKSDQAQSQAVVLLRNRNTIGDLLETLPMVPTLSEGIKLAAMAFTRDISKVSCCV
jgi:hypothetical protein